MELSRRPCDRYTLPSATIAWLANDGSLMSSMIFAPVEAMESEVPKAKSNV
jgi:hypothetical protein